MTERVRIEHTFECSETAFWETFQNEEYNHQMFRGRMKFPRWEIVSRKEEGPLHSRVIEVEPYVSDLPGPIKKAIGDNIRYREEGTLDLSKNSYQVRVTPTRMSDKIITTGTQYTEAIDEHRCRRVFEAEVQVKIFGIGSLIERQIISDMKKSYDIGAAFTQEYLREHGIR